MAGAEGIAGAGADLGPTELDGARFRQLVEGAVELLARRSPLINNLNVFPVPDGDTGTNMLLTLRSGVRAAAEAPATTVGDTAAALARGALLGARGNSGVILSQYLRGLAEGLDGQPAANSTIFARALAAASAAARAAVSEPVEGTMLTVARDVANATERSARANPSLATLLGDAVAAARASVERTPTLLPILREANVVDAGGKGLETVLEGMQLTLEGAELPPAEAVEQIPPAATRLQPDCYGYCTEFLIHGSSLDVPGIRSAMAEQGSSLLVVGDAQLVRVHLHTFRPGQAIDAALGHGKVDQIKIEDMQEQNLRLRGESAVAICGLVVVAAGQGFQDLFRSLGAGGVVTGGATLNPSAEEILRMVRASGAAECVLLPNNPNVILAAEQARSLADRPIAIVPTRDMAEGVAAALAFDSVQPAAENERAMRRAAGGVRTAQITRAVRDARIDGQAVAAGAVLGLIDNHVEVVGENLPAVVEQALAHLRAEDLEIITLYTGDGVPPEEAEDVADRLRHRFPEQQIEIVPGGQPHYPYLLSCE